MARIVALQELALVFRGEGLGRIVLVGGCFDILHIGHMRFLSEARGTGDYLVVLLESDEKVKQLKGENRPIFIQKERAEMLASLRSVDLVVLLPIMETDSDYLKMLREIKPYIIAVAENDRQIEKRKFQAIEVGSGLKIISTTKTYSTSTLAKILGLD